MKKVIVITGASSGMGKVTAIRLAQEGHTVYGLARRIEKMKELEEAGGHALELDITDYAVIKKHVAHIIEKESRIDVLWNNAGYDVMGAVEDVSLEDAKAQMDVNLFGLAEMTKAVLPHMRNEKSGLIVNTSSVGGKIFTPLNAWYHASKHALEGWSDCLRMEVKPFGINVVILQPGAIRTELSDHTIEPLLKRSENSAYKSLVDKLVKGLLDPNSMPKISDPKVISDAMVKILESPRPRTRYAVGYMAKPLIIMRYLLSDRLFERLVMSATT